MFYKTTALAGVAAAALISAPFASAQEAMAPTSAERVTEGNLVMENIPEIPEEVSEKLRQYQNVRTHGFAGHFHRTPSPPWRLSSSSSPAPLPLDFAQKQIDYSCDYSSVLQGQ